MLGDGDVQRAHIAVRDYALVLVEECVPHSLAVVERLRLVRSRVHIDGLKPFAVVLDGLVEGELLDRGVVLVEPGDRRLINLDVEGGDARAAFYSPRRCRAHHRRVAKVVCDRHRAVGKRSVCECALQRVVLVRGVNCHRRAELLGRRAHALLVQLEEVALRNGPNERDHFAAHRPLERRAGVVGCVEGPLADRRERARRCE